MTVAATKLGPRRYRGRSTEELKAERRERLMAAGLDLFAERGYQNTPVELICSSAKVTTRHFYQHFKNREDLLAALLLSIRAEITGRIVAALQAETEKMQRALSTVQTIADFYLGNEKYARIGSLETFGVSPRIEQLRRESIHQLAHLISMASQDLVKAGLLPARDYQFAALAIVGAANELVVEWLTGDGDYSAEMISQEIMMLVKALIRGSQKNVAS